MGLRWMVSPSLPRLISLSSHPSLFSTPIFTLFRPASLNYCHGQATTSRGGGFREDWRVGWERWRCVYGCDERRRQLLTCQRTVYVYRCVCMCVGMRGCLRACAFVCLCDMPMGQLPATRHSCCSNGTVTTAVWHLWRINIFHSEWSYYPLLVVAKRKKEKSWKI